MTETTTTTRNVYAEDNAAGSYGLRKGVLGPVETLAQSVSAMAPSTSASLTIPLVFAYAGNATWFVYLLATGSMLLVGFCISRFARLSASPGSLYTYTANTLPPAFGVAAAWGLLLAYVATGASVAGGALYYATVLSQQFLHGAPPAVPTLAVVCGVAGFIAYRDVKLSAEVMLWIEAVSVGLIVIVLILLPVRIGFQLDTSQFRLSGVSFNALGPALVLSIFSFVGFEGATHTGRRSARSSADHSASRVAVRTPCRRILYALRLFRSAGDFAVRLQRSPVPRALCTCWPRKLRSLPWASPSIAGAFISMFACVLACATAAARVLLRMAHDGLLPTTLERTSPRHGTPGLAVALSIALMFAATTAMAILGETGSTMYDLLGSLSVFGFLTAYALVALALPFARRAVGQHSHLLAVVSVVTVAVIIVITVFDLHSASDVVHARIPYLYLAYIATGLSWYAARRKQTKVV